MGQIEDGGEWVANQQEPKTENYSNIHKRYWSKTNNKICIGFGPRIIKNLHTNTYKSKYSLAFISTYIQIYIKNYIYFNLYMYMHVQTCMCVLVNCRYICL